MAKQSRLSKCAARQAEAKKGAEAKSSCLHPPLIPSLHAWRAVDGSLTVGSTYVQDATLGRDGKYLPYAVVDLPSKAEDQHVAARIFYGSVQSFSHFQFEA
jgi:hypothetical protein